jgi:hypothetical protein
VRCLAIERVAIEVPDLGNAIHRMGRLLDTEFRVLEVALPGGTRRVAVSPLGVELLESPGSAPRLRSFHLRVADLETTRDDLERAGVPVRETFTVGSMEHLAAELEPGLRVLFVAYAGDDGFQAITASTEGTDPSPGRTER